MDIDWYARSSALGSGTLGAIPLAAAVVASSEFLPFRGATTTVAISLSLISALALTTAFWTSSAA